MIMKLKDLLGKEQEVYALVGYSERYAYREDRENPDDCRWTCDGKGYFKGSGFRRTFHEVGPDSRAKVTHVRLTRPKLEGWFRSTEEFLTPGQVIGLFDVVAAERREAIAAKRQRDAEALGRQERHAFLANQLHRELDLAMERLDCKIRWTFRHMHPGVPPKVEIDAAELHELLSELATLRKLGYRAGQDPTATDT